MSPFHRGLLKWSRLVHLYFTLFGLFLILFFAVTGFLLNHEKWFGVYAKRDIEHTGNVPTAHLKPINHLAIVEALRKQCGAIGALGDESDDEKDAEPQEPDAPKRVRGFSGDDHTLEVVFTRPGSRYVAEVNRSDGSVKAKTTTTGWIGILTDLHKGKSSGPVWSLVIDVVCIFLGIISLTGLILWSSLKSRGTLGAVCLVMGVLVSVVIYLAFVP